MKITKHAQSCLLVETGGSRILIDPGVFVFNEEGKKPEDFKNIDLLIFTHEHSDHLDLENVKKIIEASKPRVLGTHAVADQLKEICKVEITSNTDQRESDVVITGVISKHGPLPNGNQPPAVSGVVIDDGFDRLYVPGDTVMLDKSINANIIAVPICGKVVMDVQTAKSEVLKLNPEVVFPYHYDNPVFPVDVSDFETAMKNTGVKVKILKWGESFETK